MLGTHSWPIEPGLVLVLEVLLRERNVSRAAAAAGLTQSGMSRALGRLRSQLGDPLLVRSGRSMTLTPRAEAIAHELGQAVAGLERILVGHTKFAPGSSTARFHIATADYCVFLLAPLVERLQHEAPGVEVVVHPLGPEYEHDLHSGALDLVVAPRRRGGASLVWTKLLNDRFLSVVRRGHPHIKRRLDLDRFCAVSHVVVSPEPRAGNVVDRLLAEAGRRRHVALRVPSFVAALSVVSTSELMLTTPERLVRRFEEQLALASFAPPLPIPSLSLWVAWHERQRRDQAHAYLRASVAGVARSLEGR